MNPKSTMPRTAHPWRILIASSHPLFAEGLRSLLHRRQQMDAVVVGMVSTIDEAVAALKSLNPDIVIVDYDDNRVNRDEFLARFVEGQGRLRVVLLSLKEGGSEAIVYDRRTMAASQIEDWLEMWTDDSSTPSESRPVPVQQEPARRYSKWRDSMKHLIAGFLVVIVLMVLGFLGFQVAWQQGTLLPLQASMQAIPIDNLFHLHFSAIVVLFSLIVGLLAYSIVVFRRRRGDLEDGPHSEGNQALEIAWTVIPLLFVLFLAFVSSVALAETQEAEPKALRVNVVGSQWAWRFDYPDLGIISTELILPVSKQALLTLSSTDVIHSFWVPEFRVKQDLLPGDGFERQIRITPDQEGAFKVRCAEMCGRLHYNMEAPVKVLSQVDYDAWVQSQIQPVSNDPVVRGEQISQQFGCRACHSIDGSIVVGPSWKGLYGHEVQLEDGTTVTADDAYITESIRDPGTKIVNGFKNLMPATIGAELTDQQIADIIAYIASLK